MATTNNKFLVKNGLAVGSSIDVINTSGEWIGATGTLHGATGPQGATGVQGIDGASGYVGSDGATGVQGATGLTGATGTSGDRYLTSSTTSFTLADTGSQTVTVGLGLAYSANQTIILTYDPSNHQHGRVTSYNPSTGSLVFDKYDLQGSGTYASWTVNLDGAVGAQGASGVQGASGLTGATGPAGVNGASGSVGDNGATGAAGTNGVNGATGLTGATGSSAGGSSTMSPFLLVGATGSQGSTGPTGNGWFGGALYIGPQGATGVAWGATGSIRATGSVSAFFSSDKTLKENIKDIPNALDKVIKIGGKIFDWTDEYIENNGGLDSYFQPKADFGVIAQDVQEVFPVAVRTREDGTLAVDYEKLCALAFAAIKELNDKIENK